MRKKLTIILLLICISVSAQHKTWSFYVDGGIGTNSDTHAENIEIPQSTKDFLFTKGILDVNIKKDLVFRPNYQFSLGVSRYINDNVRITIQGSNQNINQKNYDATGFFGDITIGYNFIHHPYHELFLESGLGGLFTFNHYYLNWEGKSSDGSTVIINGNPEQYKVDLGRHNTQSVTIPVKLSYDYNFKGRSWIGIYAQCHYNPMYNNFTSILTGSVGIEYRYTLTTTPRKRKHKQEIIYVDKLRTDTIFVEKKDTIYINHTDTVIEKCEEDSIDKILFELDSYKLTPYAKYKLDNIDYDNNNVITIIGEACSIGNLDHNITLAKMRVQEVKKYILNKGYKGIINISTGVSEWAAPDFRSVKIKLDNK